jgi:hypothetical protein
MAKGPDVLYTRIRSFISSSETQKSFLLSKISFHKAAVESTNYDCRFWGKSKLRGFENLRETTGSHRGLCGEEETVEDHRRTVLQAVRLGAEPQCFQYICVVGYMPQKEAWS